MPKNVIVCCDGTANEFAKDNTNVVKLYSVLSQRAGEQIAFYHPGIGTMEAPGALTTVGRALTKIAGLAFGYGLQADIRDAYVYIMNHYEPGDRLFMFGFSRGAYTVKMVASLLRLYGLIRPGNESLVPYALRRMHAIYKEKDAKVAFDLADEFKKTFCGIQCAPYFVGLWDCVSSVGWIGNPLKVPYSANNPDIEIGRHAISIDERRAFFRSNLWRARETPGPNGPRDLKQVWFAGVHCDVGGGYPEDESGLSKISLKWMIEEAVAKGLIVNREHVDLILGVIPDKRFAQPDAGAPMHQSLTWKWWIPEFLPKPHYNWKTKREGRRMNLFRARTIPAGAVIHESVGERINADPQYRPRLPAGSAI
jgi:uncharacterized protein (DUF2235 family)